MILAQLTERPGTLFDIQKLHFLGREQKDRPVVLWSPARPERNFKEVFAFMRDKGAI